MIFILGDPASANIGASMSQMTGMMGGMPGMPGMPGMSGMPAMPGMSNMPGMPAGGMQVSKLILLMSGMMRIPSISYQTQHIS